MARKAQTKEKTKAEKPAYPTRALWNGNIAFGLVNVPVSLHSMEKKFDLHFKLLDNRNHAGIHYERINDETGEEVPWDEIVKGYEYSKGNYVVITEEEFKEAAGEAEPIVEIRDFVHRSEIEDVFFDKPYVLVPARRAEKGYVLLREVMRETETVGIARMPVRTREYLTAVMPLEDAIVVMVLRYAQELRQPEDFSLPAKKDYEISRREFELAEKLVESMTIDWEPEKYHDEYHDRLMKWIEEKAETGKIHVPKHEESEREEARNVIDLTDLLRKSMGDGKPKKKAKAKGA